MKGLILTCKGLEDVAAKELKDITGKSCDQQEFCITFECNAIQLGKLAYTSQIASSVICLLFEFRASAKFEDTIAQIKSGLKDVDFSEWVSPGITFKVKAQRTGEHEYNSQDIMLECIKTIKEKTNLESSLDESDLCINVVIINSKGYLGIDFAGLDLSKREYRIFAHPAALKGTIAAGLSKLSGCKKSDTIMDPFSKSGMISIEAALMLTKTPVNFYRKEKLAFRGLKGANPEEIEEMIRKVDEAMLTEITGKNYCVDASMPSITAAQKNAKLAGVNKQISFSRMELEWFDTKFQEKEIDHIITCPPELSKRLNLSIIAKLYKELFYQLDYIMSDKGKITVICKAHDQLSKFAEQKKFAMESKRIISSGKEQYQIVQYSRKS